jgi:hypothetical protein
VCENAAFVALRRSKSCDESDVGREPGDRAEIVGDPKSSKFE